MDSKSMLAMNTVMELAQSSERTSAALPFIPVMLQVDSSQLASLAGFPVSRIVEYARTRPPSAACI